MTLKTSDFDYYLPEELIAQTPIAKRDTSRLMVIDRKSGSIEHKHFYDIIEYLNEGDALVLNNSRVIPARVYGKKKDTGANIEILLLKPVTKDIYEIMAKPAKRLREGSIIIFSDELEGKIVKKMQEGIMHIEFICEGEALNYISELGEMPLPPYIKEKLKDKERYQTVYSQPEGSSAAPTAGLHFTNELLEKIRQKGINIIYITLHVGLGTFRPVKEDDLSNHIMHSEYYEISEKAAEKINEVKVSGGKIIAVGTTSVRALESCYEKYGEVRECFENTDIFIYPGFKFRVADSLITNFHLPKSTLIMLISAFYDRDKVLECYDIAVKEKYRFFSFGDAMLLR